MRKMIIRMRHRLPKYFKNVWYNQSVHMEEHKFPIVFDAKNNYIDCTVGLKVPMVLIYGSKVAFYEIIEINNSKGSDWFYSSDSINCKMKFSHIGTIKGYSIDKLTKENK